MHILTSGLSFWQPNSMKTLNVTAIAGLVLCGSLTAGMAQDPKPDITVDFSQGIGNIKPLHGVNGGSFSYGPMASPLTAFHAEAGFPYTRLHDTNWPCPNAVDVHTIFPLFDADADDPANYTFENTDDCIAPIIKNKSEIIYRLGESIEHKTRYHIHPPKDYQKWAKICVNIIRHYNDGWSKGFHYNIKYWEVWNEPEGKNMWLGTPQQYFELYETTAKAVKAYNPALKVGGPGSTSIHSSLVKAFIPYCRDRHVPLDFLSWHLYINKLDVFTQDTRFARALLDECGFQKTESHLNEWHYFNVDWKDVMPGNQPHATLDDFAKVRKLMADTVGPEGAAFTAAVLMRLQDCPVDVANYYCADYNPFSMFDSFGIPSKTYYVFKAFNELAKTHDRVTCKIANPNDGVTVAAGLSENRRAAAILVSRSSLTGATCHLALKGFLDSSNLQAEVYQIDEAHNLELTAKAEVGADHPVLDLKLPPNSVCLVTCLAAQKQQQ